MTDNLNTSFATWLWKNPRILATAGWCAPALKPDPTIVLLYTAFHATGPALLQRHEKWKALRPQDTLYHMVEEREAYEYLIRAGISAVYMTTNAWLEFDRYRPVDKPKEFNAVMSGRMHPDKRHELAAEVKALLVMGREQPLWDPPGYTSTVRALLPQATFDYIDMPLMRFAYGRARVGLCLSAVEGACRSGSEMQLCGLPVVTTRAAGARLETLNPVYSTVVADTPGAVADAVRMWVSRLPDPSADRNSTLALLRKHRRVGIDLVQSIFDANHVTVEFEALLHRRPVRFLDLKDLNMIEDFIDEAANVR